MDQFFPMIHGGDTLPIVGCIHRFQVLGRYGVALTIRDPVQIGQALTSLGASSLACHR